MADTPDKETRREAEEVARELHMLLHHPEVSEILSNDWVQDSSLPIPSVRAILLLFSLLSEKNAAITADGKTVNLLEHIASGTEEVTLPALLAELRAYTLEDFMGAARREASFHQSDELRHEGGRAYEWTHVLRLFTHLSAGGGTLRDHGARAISRRFLEGLLLRALLHRDVAALRGLAQAVEGSPPATTGGQPDRQPNLRLAASPFPRTGQGTHQGRDEGIPDGTLPLFRGRERHHLGGGLEARRMAHGQ